MQNNLYSRWQQKHIWLSDSPSSYDAQQTLSSLIDLQVCAGQQDTKWMSDNFAFRTLIRKGHKNGSFLLNAK
jgi:hypothetical protein